MYISHGYLIYLLIKTEDARQKHLDSGSRNSQKDMIKSYLMDFLAKGSINIAAAAKSIKSLF